VVRHPRAADWAQPGFDDAAWPPPSRSAACRAPARTPGRRGWTPVEAEQVAGGELVERLLLLEDDPAAALFAAGCSRTGRCRRTASGRASTSAGSASEPPSVDVTAPAGTAVDLVYCEDLVDGRVTPGSR
jgi:hypothetical protein